MSATQHPAGWPEEALLSACDVRTQRRSGPGGQHRNKVETGVFITYRAATIEAAATEKRNQTENRKVAIARLRRILAVQLRTPVDGSGPSERWRSRLRGSRIECSASHEDFPALLAEALDFLDADAWDYPKSAAKLQCTGTQLLKFLKKEPAAWDVFNEGRGQSGLPRLSF